MLCAIMTLQIKSLVMITAILIDVIDSDRSVLDTRTLNWIWDHNDGASNTVHIVVTMFQTNLGVF